MWVLPIAVFMIVVQIVSQKHADGFTHTSSGMLTGLIDPNGMGTPLIPGDGEHTYEYDEETGRLELDVGLDDNSTGMARVEDEDGYTVTTTSTLGRTGSMGVAPAGSAEQTRTWTGWDGYVTTTERTETTRSTVMPDGSARSLSLGPDPRFGMASPIVETASLTSGVAFSSSLAFSEAVVLADAEDPLSLTALTDTVELNGHVWTRSVTVENAGDPELASAEETVTSPVGRTVVRTLDAMGRVVRVERPGIEDLEVGYDTHGRLETVSQGSRLYTWVYESDGDLYTITDPESRVTTLEHDLAGRLMGLELPGGRTVGFTRDRNGTVIGLTPPDRDEHQLPHTGSGLLSSYDPPDVEASPSPLDIGGESYDYNADLQWEETSRSDGVDIDPEYDEETGRLTSILFGAESVTRSYDEETGALSGVTRTDGCLLYTSDAADE